MQNQKLKNLLLALEELTMSNVDNEIIAIGEQKSIKLLGGLDYTNQSCHNSACADCTDNNNSCTNQSCSTEKGSNQSCSNIACTGVL